MTGNRIGTQADGTGAVPNGGAGIVVAAGGCQIGGSGTGEGNTIAGNTGDGILVQAADAVVLGNTIRSNGGAGVRSPGAAALLRGNSITANGGLGHRHRRGRASAPARRNSPQSCARAASCTSPARSPPPRRARKTSSSPATPRAIPAAPARAPPRSRIKTILVASPGTAPFDVVLDTDVPAGTNVTATASTDGQTSEFAACATVTEPGATIVTLTPTTRSVLEGATAGFTVHRSGDTSALRRRRPGRPTTARATAPDDFGAGGSVHFDGGPGRRADQRRHRRTTRPSSRTRRFTVTLDSVTNATITEIGDARRRRR